MWGNSDKYLGQNIFIRLPAHSSKNRANLEMEPKYTSDKK